MTTRLVKSEALKFRLSWFVWALIFKTCMALVTILVAFSIFYGEVAYAEAFHGWTKTMGGTSTDEGYSVAVDSSGNVCIIGGFLGTVDFDPDPVATDEHTSIGEQDIFLTKINADGSYGWTKTIGGIKRDYADSGAVDSNSNIYVSGFFWGTVDFDPDPVATDEHTSANTLAGYNDLFLTRINADGSYGWTKTIGGTNGSVGYVSAAVDSSDNIYVSGSFGGTVDFDPDPVATDEHIGIGSQAMYLTKINADGSYGWTKTMGGTISLIVVYSVAVDSSGNVYVSGSFTRTVDFDPDPVATDEHTSVGEQDIFLTKINADGSYGWTKTMGNGGGFASVGSSGNVYMTGSFQGTADFNPDPVATDEHTSIGEQDIFLTKINADGSYGWTKTIGGEGYDGAYSVAVDSSGNVYITGRFSETVDFDPDPVATDEHTSFYLDIFLTRINADGSYGWTKTVSAFQLIGHSITVDSSENIFWTGSFQGNADFDPDPVTTDEHTSTADSFDIFLTKFLKESPTSDEGDDVSDDSPGATMPWIPLLLTDD